MKVYKTNRPFLVKKRNGKEYIQFAKNQIIVIDDKKVWVQGKVNRIRFEVFEDIQKSYITQVEDIDKEFLDDYVIPNEDYKKIKSIHSKANKELKKYSKVLKTIKTWVFSPKGSKAAKIEHELEFQENSITILEETVLGGGIKSKPGDFRMNRGTERFGPFVENDEEWSNDTTTILPYGIRKSDHASQSEVVKIYKKIMQQVISMEDCPTEFKEFFQKNLEITPDNEPFRDYLPFLDKKTRKLKEKQKLMFSDFNKNKHHSKTKGLELCHIDPWQEFTTTADNITIGSSWANRFQGGNPISAIVEVFTNC